MNRIRVGFFLAVSVVAIGLGCQSSAKKQQQAQASQAAVLATQQQLMLQMMQQTNAVSVIGEVRNARVQWSEDLHVSQALVSAEYLGRRDPSAIYLHRRGTSMYISPRRLLMGIDDPVVEAGDILEIRR